MESKMNLALGLVAAASLAVATQASAATILSFQTGDLDDGGAGAPVPDVSDTPTTVAGGTSSSDLTLGAGLTGLNWPRTLDVNGLFGVSDLTASIAGDKYWTVTITPDAGQEIDFSNLHIVLGVNVGTAVGDNQVALTSSLTGFTVADIITTFEPVTTANGALVTTTFDANLSSVAALQGVSGAVEFRLYAVAGNRIGIGQPFSAALADDLRFDGTVNAVPEPASLALMGLGGVAIMLRKRG